MSCSSEPRPISLDSDSNTCTETTPSCSGSFSVELGVAANTIGTPVPFTSGPGPRAMAALGSGPGSRAMAALSLTGTGPDSLTDW